MILKNSVCKVTIEEAPAGFSESAYRYIYNFAQYEPSDLTKLFSVHIVCQGKAVRIGILGSYLASVDQCAILEGVTLTLMHNEQFFKIDISDGSVVNYKEVDVFGSNFALYRVKDGYVVHGEIEILKLDEEFNTLWSFSGRDIFVSGTGKCEFLLTESSIQLYDFEDNYYEIDLDGNVL